MTASQGIDVIRVTSEAVRAVLTAERIRRGLSQQQLAQLLGLKTRRNIELWERGVKAPGLISLIKWATALDYCIELKPSSMTAESVVRQTR